MRFYYLDPDQVRYGEYLVIRKDGNLDGFDKNGHVFGAETVRGTKAQ